MSDPATEEHIGVLTALLIQTLVRSHIQQLPTNALEAAMDLLTIGGPDALARVIADELISRQPRPFRP